MPETVHIVCGPTEGASARVVYPVAEVGRRLGVSRRHVYRLARRGAFDISDQSGISVVDADQLARFEARRAVSS